MELARGRVEMRRSLRDSARLPVPNHDLDPTVVRVVRQLEVAWCMCVCVSDRVYVRRCLGVWVDGGVVKFEWVYSAGSGSGSGSGGSDERRRPVLHPRTHLWEAW